MEIDNSVFSTSPEVPSDYTRLHIAPLNPALLGAIIPPSILPSARNISYHSLQTFPEKGFGFVELPIMDAEKIKKKLHGSILKGTKIRIEEARPVRDQAVEEDKPAKPKKEKAEKSKKRKRDEVIPGAELHDRKVKRGWTDPTAPRRSEKKSKDKKDKKDKKEVVRSKYTSGPECLFRTTVPANVAAAAKDATQAKDKRKGKSGKETVVHEFAKTTKYATFLRQTNGPAKTKGVAEFVEGKGWVDEEGNVVEEAVIRKRPAAPTRTEKKKKILDAEEDQVMEDERISEDESFLTEADLTTSTLISSQKQAALDDVEDSTSSSGTSSDEEESSTDKSGKPLAAEDDDSTSSSGTSSEEEDSETDSSDAESTTSSKNVSPSPATTSRPVSSSGTPRGLSIKIPPPPTASTEVHPLEALFKRPKPSEISVAETPKASASFSFFGADNEDIDAEEHAIPMTPFTQQDFAHRGLRSAAPTPDTAHPGRKFWAAESDNGGEDDYDDEAGPASSPSREKAGTKGKGKEEAKEADGAPISDFQKWFYENRGDTNRAWKKRRKVASKEKRQRENRKRGEQRN
jgi:hypothetical protein